MLSIWGDHLVTPVDYLRGSGMIDILLGYLSGCICRSGNKIQGHWSHSKVVKSFNTYSIDGESEYGFSGFFHTWKVAVTRSCGRYAVGWLVSSSGNCLIVDCNKLGLQVETLCIGSTNSTTISALQFIENIGLGLSGWPAPTLHQGISCISIAWTSWRGQFVDRLLFSNGKHCL